MPFHTPNTSLQRQWALHSFAVRWMDTPAYQHTQKEPLLRPQFLIWSMNNRDGKEVVFSIHRTVCAERVLMSYYMYLHAY